MSAEMIHLVATVFMAGLIVFVQVVHYPLMALVGETAFVTFERQHTVRTGWVVVPPMVIELLAACWLVMATAGGESAGLARLGLGLLALIWVSTALVQAPAHGRLIEGFDERIHRRLVRSNWLRTVAWLGRVPIAVALLG